MQAGDTEGVVGFSIDFADAVGNAGTTVVATTDASTVIFDGAPATVVGVDSTSADGTYYRGDVIDINVAFSEAVTVDTTGGTPTLRLETGSTDRNAQYVSGSGTARIVFRYTISKGDSNSDLDYVSANALRLNGSIMQDTASNNAVLTLPVPGAAGSLSANSDLVVDGLLSFEQGSVIIRNNILNPRRGEVTIINLRLEERSNVSITVYDLAGDPVKSLCNRSMPSGMNEISWDGKSRRGKPVTQGVYYVVVKIGNERHVRKVLVVK
jgi:hypothetical protein